MRSVLSLLISLGALAVHAVMWERESSHIGECAQAIFRPPYITEVATVHMYYRELNPYSEPDLTRVKLKNQSS